MRRIFIRINAAGKWFQVLGFAWITPILRAIAGDNPKAQVKDIFRLLAVPLLAISAFLSLWDTLAATVQTSLGSVPGPSQVCAGAVNVHADAQNKAESRARF